MSSAVSRWLHSKTPTEAPTGMVVARHPLAAQAGCETLQAGGNAVDACVAASFATSVVQPVASTIGGGGQLVVAMADGRRGAIDYRYTAPGRAHAGMFELGGPVAESDLFGYPGVRGHANEIGPRAVAVPGSIAGLTLAAEQFGVLPLSDLVEPALALATEGFEVDWYSSLMQAVHLDLLTSFPHTAATFLRDGRYPMRPRTIGPADVHRQPALGATLREIARDGRDGFYRGRSAEAIVKEVRSGGGLIEPTDLERFSPVTASPPEVELRRFAVLGPLNMAVIVPLVRMLALADLHALDPCDPRRFHLIVEMLRLARADQHESYGDENFSPSTWAALSSPTHAADRLARIDDRHRGAPVATSRRFPTARGEGTVHISAMDSAGNAASLTETVLGNWGSGVTTESGVLLNNGMVGFDPRPGRANSIAPGRRPVSFMSPLIVLDERRSPLLALGASGGRRISAAVLQVMSNVLDLGMDMQDAVAAPRVDLIDDAVLADQRLPASVIRDLEARGHRVVSRSEELCTFEFANPCGVLRTASGSLQGGVNPYQATAAVGY
jgi:gamma-glutamyltranspeptidase/glutathione hydrolase